MTLALDDAPATPLAEPDAATLADAEALYDRGLYLRAHQRLLAYGSPRAWTDPRALIFAARLWGNLGGSETAEILTVRAWRRARGTPALLRVAYFYLQLLLERRGPLTAWEVLQRLPPSADADPRTRANLFVVGAEILTEVRDFDAADEAFTSAEQIDPDHLWWRIGRSIWHERQDDLAAALAAANACLDRAPTFRPALNQAAKLLHELGRSHRPPRAQAA